MVLVGLLVFATARRLESMQDLASLPGIVLIQLDVTQEPSIQEALRHVESYLHRENESCDPDTKKISPGLDILVNNAGITTILPFADTPISVSQQIIETNVIAPMSVTKAFLPLLVKSGDACIVCTGSVAGFIPTVGCAYNASKAALRTWCDTLRIGDFMPYYSL
jgi:1-acylglycerone phosphate reductase